MTEDLVRGILDNNHGSISKAITVIENSSISKSNPFSSINNKNKKCFRIGITGPPGAGKSTLTNKLIETILSKNKTVGVIAVDPTSPFSGGSLLGDRVRMNKYMWDDRVFIRSMGSHGDLGGLARKSQEVGDLLEASGKDYIIFETVGVGQGEIDIASSADVTAVVLVPESGDEIQLMKAGLIEIADLFVINKSDRNGANKLASLLKTTLHQFSKKDKLIPEVFNTISTKGEGITEVFSGILDLLKIMKDSGTLEKRRINSYRERIYGMVGESLEDIFWTDDKKIQLESLLKAKGFKSSHIDGLVKQIFLPK